jgi:hypothetical protein
VGFTLFGRPPGHVLLTMTNTTLRTRIALCLSALAAAVALAAIAAPANAGAATNVQLRSDFYTSANSPTPMMAVNPANAATFMAAPNAPEARWSRELAGGGIFRFRNAQFQSCLKVPESTPSQSDAPAILGSCASPRSQWRQLTVGGTPRVLINAATGHAIAPPLCIDGGPCDTRMHLIPGKDAATISMLLGWTVLAV